MGKQVCKHEFGHTHTHTFVTQIVRRSTNKSMYGRDVFDSFQNELNETDNVDKWYWNVLDC